MKNIMRISIVIVGIIMLLGCDNEKDTGGNNNPKSLWKKMSINFNTNINCMKAIGTKLYAGSASYNGGLFVSPDSGITWTEVILEAQFKPYINHITELNGIILISTGNGLYKSTDNGISWNEDTTFTTTQALNIECQNIASIGNVHYLALNATTYHPITSVYFSTNNGLNWNPISTELQLQLKAIVSINQTLIVSGIYAYPFFSTNNGINWINPTSPIPNPGYLRDLLVWKGSTFAVTEDRGIISSYGYPNYWTTVNTGLPIELNALSLSFNDSLLFLSAADSGVYKTRDGENWSTIGENNLISAGILYVWGNYLYTNSNNEIWRMRINDL